MRSKAQIIGLILGIILTPVTVIIAISASGMGHGSYKPAMVLFPYSMLFAKALSHITWPLVVMACVQFPAYGWLLGRAMQSDRQRHAMWLIPMVHVIFLAITFSVQSSAFY